MAELLAIDLFGFGAPGRRAGQVPVDRQWNAYTGHGDVAARDEASRGIVLVVLEGRRADIAAACPSVDGDVIGPDRSRVFVEGDIAANEVAAVRQSVLEFSGSGEKQQPCGLHGAARENE